MRRSLIWAALSSAVKIESEFRHIVKKSVKGVPFCYMDVL